MIHLSNGHTFQYMAASGALGFDGQGWPWERPLRWLGLLDPRLFTIVIKTLTRYPRRGNLRWSNPFGCVRFVKGGTINAVGLTNPGIDWWCESVGPKVAASGFQLVGSIARDDVKELVYMARRLNDFPLVGLELNASCPNSQAEMMTNSKLVAEAVQAARKTSRHPLIVKLSVQHDYINIAKSLTGMADAISINSVPWRMIYGEIASPLQHLGGGGVSGKAAQTFTWKMVQELVEGTSIPVIGPSVWEFEDIARLNRLGAKAISFGAIFLRYPWRPTIFVKRNSKEFSQKDKVSVANG